MLEKTIQAKIIKFLKQKNHFCYKHLATSVNGIPDIMCIIHGIPVFIEVKRPGGRATELQELKIAEIVENNGVAFAVHSYEAFLDKYNEIKLFFEMHGDKPAYIYLREFLNKVSISG